MSVAKGVSLNHIARESADIKRLATFYQQVLGFEQIESPKYGEFEVIWMKLPPSFSLHLIQRNPSTKLPEGPYSSDSSVKDPKNLPRGHHVSFAVSNFDEFVQSLKEYLGYMMYVTHPRQFKGVTYIVNLEKGIETFEKIQPDGKTKQVFFFDPDGNGLEVGNFGTQSE